MCDNSNCQPKAKIIFLKTHKCASSTIQNILFRKALQNDLNVVMPPEGNYIGKYVPFNPRMIRQVCQMAKLDPFLSLDCARVEDVGEQSKERKGSKFAA